jgi:hypothetical protein
MMGKEEMRMGVRRKKSIGKKGERNVVRGK